MTSHFDPAQQMSNLWCEFASKVASAGAAFSPDNAPSDMSRQMRGATFDAMSKATDQFLRSPLFLDMMKQSMEASINFRKQMNDWLTQVQHSAQGVAMQDISSILLAVRHMEKRTLDQLEEIASRMAQISERLDALEGKRAEHA